MPERQPPPGECANCGAVIPPSARACPECGADERTGWRESSVYDGLDLPATGFDDDADHERNRRGQPSPTRINGVAWYWWFAAVILLLAVAVMLIGGL